MRRASLCLGFAGAATMLVMGSATQAAQLSDFAFFRTTAYTQSSGIAPTVPDYYYMTMNASTFAAGAFDSAAVTYPGGSQVVPVTGPTNFTYNSPTYPSLAALEADYAAGDYTLTTDDSSGTNPEETSTIHYTQDAFPVGVASLTATSYAALQGMNSAMGVSLSHTTFTPAAGSDEAYQFINIFDAAGNDVFSLGFLNPSDTSFAIPAGTLAANTAYRMEIDFSDRVVDLSGAPRTDQGFEGLTRVEFTTGAVPEPGTMGLMMIGVVGLVRRRR